MFKNTRLRTRLAFSYSLVALIALLVVGALALPLLVNIQNSQAATELRARRGEYAEALDRLYSRAIKRADKYGPAGVLLQYACVMTTTPVTCPPTPDQNTLNQQFNELRNDTTSLRLLMISLKGQVLFDGESDPNDQLTGLDLSAQLRYIQEKKDTPNLEPNPDLMFSGRRYFFDSLTLPKQRATSQIVYFGNSTFNLYGLNSQGKPTPVFFAVVFPTPITTNALNELAWVLSVAGLVALVVSVIVGVLFARSLSRPLVKATRATGALIKGDYSQRVPVAGGYELEQLAESFNHMSKELGEAQRMQRDLIANVSHELKTPLTAIRGFSQAMLDGALTRPEQYARPAHIIHDETERMIRLVNSLLDLSRLESRQVRLAKDEVDLSDILEHSVSSFEQRATDAEILLVRIFEPVPPLWGDYDRLRQVFNNLIDNALRYTPKLGSITATCKQVGNEVVASVTDTGAGIASQDLPHIFERFYQSDKSRSRNSNGSGGLGLGLAICKEIVQAHGGKIEVKSEVGQGTKFIVRLPVMADKPEAKSGPKRAGGTEEHREMAAREAEQGLPSADA